MKKEDFKKLIIGLINSALDSRDGEANYDINIDKNTITIEIYFGKEEQ